MSDLLNICNCIVKILSMLIYIYFLWKFYRGDKNDIRTMQYGFLMIMYLIFTK